MIDKIMGRSGSVGVEVLMKHAVFKKMEKMQVETGSQEVYQAINRVLSRYMEERSCI